MIKSPFKKGYACWLSKAEGDLLVKAAPHSGAKIAIRLGLNGLRVHEIAKITNEDKIHDETVGLLGRVIGKATPEYPEGKPRTFPLDSRLEFADFELCNVSTRTLISWMDTTRKAAARLSGDDDYHSVTMHDLRRSWAVQCLAQGVLPETVKYWGGWELNSTVFEQFYLSKGIQSPDYQKLERGKLDY